jgi:hypothetical protein
MNLDTKETEVELGMMQSEEDDSVTLQFPVSDHLKQKLEDQYRLLQSIELSKKPVERYRAARAAGVMAAFAKGIRSRRPETNHMTLPSTEFQIKDGSVWISCLRASIPNVPPGIRIRSLLFVFGDDGKFDYGISFAVKG